MDPSTWALFTVGGQQPPELHSPERLRRADNLHPNCDLTIPHSGPPRRGPSVCSTETLDICRYTCCMFGSQSIRRL